MISNARPLLVFLAGILFAIPISAHADQRSDAVNKLFERWNTSSTPGLNIAVFRDGKPVYEYSYGMANLELSQPNNARLVYPIGSISKQFVGYCVQLLASEGKLSLRDDVRRYLPEMHDFGDPITLEMLLTQRRESRPAADGRGCYLRQYRNSQYCWRPGHLERAIL